MRRPLLRLAEAAMLLGAVLALVSASDFTLATLTQAVGYGIAVLSVKMLAGFTGQFSLGHTLFLAIGAYVTAALVDAGALNVYLAIPLATLTAFAAGALIGLAAVRIRGDQLAIATFLLALALPQIARSDIVTAILGGRNEINLSPAPSPMAGLSTDEWWFLVTTGVAVLLCVGFTLLLRTPFGRAMQAGRDNPIAAAAAGVNLGFTGVVSFAISAGTAGLAGGLLMMPVPHVGPDSFNVILAVGLFIAVILTGMHWLAGAFVGGLLMIYLPHWAEALSMQISPVEGGLIWVIYGLALLVAIYLQAIPWRGRFPFSPKRR